MTVVQAAHLRRVSDGGNDRWDNGILLRVDVHLLFDLDLIAIDPDTLKIHVSRKLQDSEYYALEGQRLRVPESPKFRPNLQWLRERWGVFDGRRTT
jgi:predicted restriction endonuclease